MIVFFYYFLWCFFPLCASIFFPDALHSILHCVSSYLFPPFIFPMPSFLSFPITYKLSSFPFIEFMFIFTFAVILSALIFFVSSVLRSFSLSFKSCLSFFLFSFHYCIHMFLSSFILYQFTHSFFLILWLLPFFRIFLIPGFLFYFFL